MGLVSMERDETMGDNQMRIAVGCLVFSLLFCAAGVGIGLYGNWERVQEWTGGSAPAAGAEASAKLAEEFPDSTAGAVVIRQPMQAAESLREFYELARDAGLDETDMGEDFSEARSQSQKVLGFDATKPEEWKSTGLDLDEPIVMGVFADEEGSEPRGIMLTATVSEKSELEEFLVDIRDVEEAESETISGENVRTADDLHLAYDGNLAYIMTADPKRWDNPKERLVELMETPSSGASLADVEGFQDFENALLDKEMIAAFVNPESPAMESAFDDAAEEIASDGAIAPDATEKIRQHLTGVGFGASAESETMEIRYRGWAGVDSEGREATDEILAPERSISWENFVTEKTTGALRLSIRPDAVWKESKESMSAEGEKQMEQASNALEAQAGTDVDIEKDVIDALSGDAGLVIYDISNIVGDDGGFRWGGMLSVKFFGLIQFKEKSDLDNLLEKAREALDNPKMGTSPELRNLKTNQGKEVEGIRVLDLGNPMFPKLYAQDALLAVAPGSLGEGAVRSYLEGTRSETSLAEVEGVDLGKKFATEKNLNGMYMNFSRLQDSIGEMLSDEGEFATFMDLWREGALTGYVNDEGVFVELRGQMQRAEQ